MIRIGLIGCGQWGQNCIRNFGKLGERATIAYYADAEPGRLTIFGRMKLPAPDSLTSAIRLSRLRLGPPVWVGASCE
jgi:predicted dehydrogenase